MRKQNSRYQANIAIKLVSLRKLNQGKLECVIFFDLDLSVKKREADMF